MNKPKEAAALCPLRKRPKPSEIKALEELDRSGYEKHPDRPDEAREWQREQVWPEDWY